MSERGRGVLAFVALAMAVLAPAVADEDANRGALVIVGGALDPGNEAVHRAMLDRRLGGQPICVIPLASAEPRVAASNAVRAFSRWGGRDSAVAVDLSTANAARADDPAFARNVRACGGVWFTGGDQSRIVDALRPEGRTSAVMEEILALWRSGAPVGGTSAGAAVMSDPMIGGGDPIAALDHGATDDDAQPGVWLRSGLGLLADGITDQHFLARSRLPRLLVALEARARAHFGAGVDEDTALVVEGSIGRVQGASSVAYVTRRDDGFTLWLLGAGDTVDLATGHVTVAQEKTPLDPRPGALKASRRPLDGDALFVLLARLARASDPDATVRIETDRGASLSIARDAEFWAKAPPGEHGRTVPRRMSAGPYRLAIARESARKHE